MNSGPSLTDAAEYARGVNLRRALADNLRSIREGLRLTSQEVAATLDWSLEMLEEIESARLAIHITNLWALLALYGVEDDDIDRLVSLSRMARRNSARAIHYDYAGLLALEAHSASIFCWSPHEIPELLQIEQYTRALLGVSGDVREEYIGCTVDFLRDRQKLVRARGQQFCVVLAEEVLRYSTDSNPVMVEQLAALEAGALSGAFALRILTLDSSHGEPESAFVPFAVLIVGDEQLGETAAFRKEGSTDSWWVRQHETGRYTALASLLQSIALEPDESLGVLRDLIVAARLNGIDSRWVADEYTPHGGTAGGGYYTYEAAIYVADAMAAGLLGEAAKIAVTQLYRAIRRRKRHPRMHEDDARLMAQYAFRLLLVRQGFHPPQASKIGCSPGIHERGTWLFELRWKDTRLRAEVPDMDDQLDFAVRFSSRP